MRLQGLSRAALVSILLLAAALSQLSLVSAADSYDSLVTAIQAANSNGSGEITLSVDIVLTAPLPAITGSLTIDGAGFSISGNDAHRIFDVNGGRLTLNNTTLTGGNGGDEEGGAVRLRDGARFTANDVTFDENSAREGGAIASDISDVRIAIARSAFLRNYADDYGGAIYIQGGTSDISQSSFQLNSAGSSGGAIGAIDVRLSVSNSTFSNNTAANGSAVWLLYDEATFTHVTMLGNRGNGPRVATINRAGGELNLYNSLIDGGADNNGCSNGLTRASGNLSDDGSCTLLGARADAKLGELTGAPAWYPLLDGSPALDTADPEYCLPADQVGTPRPHGGGCDVGAIESTTAQLAPTPIVPPPGCPLRDAINAANRDAPSGACPAGSGHDVITLDRDVKLRQPLPAISSEITIEGNGFEIGGGAAYRIFDIQGGKLTLRNVTLRGGKAVHGGAIRLRANARLTAEGVTFYGNTAEKGGAIATLTASSIATIRDSVFRRNKADIYGGAIRAQHGTVDVSGSVFLRNSAGGYGGALQIDYGNINVSNSTFHLNSAAGGGAVNMDYGNVTLTHVTMVDDRATQNNGDAIYNFEGKVDLRNSIIVSEGEADDCAGASAQSRGVVSPDGSCTLRTSADPRLDELHSSPLHFQLLDGSPAVDAALAEFCPETDQIGRARPLGGGCDIGAIESADVAPPEPRPTPTVCTLFDQILAANSDRRVGHCPAGSGADTITLTEDITLASRLPEITSELIIEGNGFTISGDKRFPLFVVRGTRITISDLTLSDGHNPRSMGGAISLLDYASAAVQNSRFNGNYAKSGGAIGLNGRDNQLTVTNSDFVENRARTDGGAIVMFFGAATIEGSSFTRNSSDFGGAISANYGGQLSVANSTFSDNMATVWGGAVAARDVSVILTHTTMVNNKAREYSVHGSGHAIWVHSRNPSFRLRNSIIGAGGRKENCYGRLTQNIGNIVEDGSCSPSHSGDAMLSDLTGTPGWYVPEPGSPAIGAADARFCLATDQNGAARSQVGGCDIGAIEAPLVVEALTGCVVTTTHGLNFRDGPGGNRIGLVPENAALAASARTSGWFNVEYDEAPGWISADYVVAAGSCG